VRPSPGSASILITPKTPADAGKLDRALRAFAGDTPPVQAMRDPDTGAILLACAGLGHLEQIVDRLKREFQVEAGVSKPTVSDERGGPRGS